MRVELLTPDGDLTPELLCSVLGLVGIAVTVDEALRWTRLERAVGYDWAIREHLAASDSQVHRRPRPSFLPEPG